MKLSLTNPLIRCTYRHTVDPYDKRLFAMMGLHKPQLELCALRLVRRLGGEAALFKVGQMLARDTGEEPGAQGGRLVE